MFNYTLLDPAKLEYIEIASLDQISNGERLFLEIGGKPVVLFNLAGKLFAIGDICSHDNGPLGDGSVEGNEVICPRHGARFNLATGKATSLPALTDIPVYPVRLVGGMIQIGIPVKHETG
jgi:3-phenylpropionate/trans-cinnamate dioxygenase ferredoxin component